MNRKNLSMELSRLNTLVEFKRKYEQYQTPSNLASKVLWIASQQGSLSDKVVCDLGCGNGVFGVGALLLGARKVYFIDIDQNAIRTCFENCLKKHVVHKGVFVKSNIGQLSDITCDTVLMNPAFMNDRLFLRKAFEFVKRRGVVYSIHKAETSGFLESFAKDNKFKYELLFEYSFPLKRTYYYHKKDLASVPVVVVKFTKK